MYIFFYIRHSEREFGFQLNGQKLRLLDDGHCRLSFFRHIDWTLTIRFTGGAEAYAPNAHFSTVIFLPSCQTNFYLVCCRKVG